MDTKVDVMQRLDDNTAIHILRFLDQPIDFARAALVSRTWRRYVLEGRLWRKLCLTKYPELKNVEEVVDVGFKKCQGVAGPSKDSYEEVLEREHRIYSDLYSQVIGSPVLKRSCIICAIAASSTDNIPQESIHETLYPETRVHNDPRVANGWSYWSSKGRADTAVPETLTYRLLSPICVVHEIKVRPFKAEFQHGSPVYSAKFVRFRLGFERGATTSLGRRIQRGSRNDVPPDYTWTYESPKYPMEQADELQSFKLPRPVLCMGQILQIELLGRVQTQQSDSLYYVCVCHVSVLGMPIPNFNFSDRGQHGGYVLIYAEGRGSRNVSELLRKEDDDFERLSLGGAVAEPSVTERNGNLRRWNTGFWHNRGLLNRLLRNIAMPRSLTNGEGSLDVDGRDDGSEEEQDDHLDMDDEL